MMNAISTRVNVPKTTVSGMKTGFSCVWNVSGMYVAVDWTWLCMHVSLV